MESICRKIMRMIKGISDSQYSYNIENDLPWDWRGSKEGYYEKMECRKYYSVSN